MRVYTVAEARALLPQVIPVLKQLKEFAAALRAQVAVVANDSIAGDGHLLADPWAAGDEQAIERRREAAGAALFQLEDWGIEVKDAARGLIDFYHERDGKLVYLCYLLGEPTIQAWHTLDGGFAGRQPLHE